MAIASNAEVVALARQALRDTSENHEPVEIGSWILQRLLSRLEAAEAEVERLQDESVKVRDECGMASHETTPVHQVVRGMKNGRDAWRAEVERLRVCDDEARTLHNTIGKLRAENARLREALVRIASASLIATL